MTKKERLISLSAAYLGIFIYFAISYIVFFGLMDFIQNRDTSLQKLTIDSIYPSLLMALFYVIATSKELLKKKN
ncbi:MAG: hypothetical protein EAZ85_05060 [Bacteroidetes bacterium]|nr:MAG: hypothetical protein EAZ85_05060 [Bacteroidota bacterium]